MPRRALRLGGPIALWCPWPACCAVGWAVPCHLGPWTLGSRASCAGRAVPFNGVRLAWAQGRRHRHTGCPEAGRERRGERANHLGDLPALRPARGRRVARWSAGRGRLHGWLHTDRAGPRAVAARFRRLVFAGALGGRAMAVALSR